MKLLACEPVLLGEKKFYLYCACRVGIGVLSVKVSGIIADNGVT